MPVGTLQSRGQSTTSVTARPAGLPRPDATTTSTGTADQPNLRPEQAVPARLTPAEQMMAAPQQHVEAAIAAMRRDGWTRERAEQWVGLPTGILTAAVDDQGRWLNQAALSDAVKDLPPAKQQEFSECLDRTHEGLQAAGLGAPFFGDPLAGGAIQHELQHVRVIGESSQPTQDPRLHAAVEPVELAQLAPADGDDVDDALLAPLHAPPSPSWTQLSHLTDFWEEGPLYIDASRAVEIGTEEFDVEAQGTERPSQRRRIDGIRRDEAASAEAIAPNAAPSLRQRRRLPLTLSVDVQATDSRVAQSQWDLSNAIGGGHPALNEVRRQVQVQQEIRDAVRGSWKSRREHYEAILTANDVIV